MPACISVDDALQRNPDSEQPVSRRASRFEHCLDLRDHEIAQRACIEAPRRQLKPRLRQGRAAEIGDQRFDQIHAE